MKGFKNRFSGPNCGGGYRSGVPIRARDIYWEFKLVPLEAP